MSIADNIQATRMAAGLTQEQLANRVGVSRQRAAAAASLLGADPSIAAGGLLTIVLLLLGFQLGRSLLRRLTQRTERSDSNAVSDR